MVEKWKPLGIRQYEISNKGRLRNARMGLIKKPCKSNKRHSRHFYRVRDSKLKKININIAREVYKLFKGPLKENMVIDHIDGNPNNNNIDNLQQITQSDNLKKADRDYSKMKKNYSWKPTSKKIFEV